MIQKIGIFGGTFNPVHNAHFEIALEFLEKFSLDLLYVIPNNIPPIKESHGVSGNDRLEMLKIAFDGQEKIVVSDMEIKRGGMSYTRDTIAELKDKHNTSELFLLIGDDWVENFVKWKDYQFILDNVNLVVAYRCEKDISLSVEKLNCLSGKKIYLLENSRIDLSSTFLRTKPEKILLPNGVYEYIQKWGLYGI